MKVPFLRRAHTLTLSAFKVDHTSAMPMFRQLHEFLWRVILAGELPPDARLPSTRALSRQLGVSRNTVLTTYEMLASEGLLIGRVGSGTRVAAHTSPGAIQTPAPQIPDARTLIRRAHYPATATGFYDPDGTALYFHRA